MSRKRSAGILLYRRRDAETQILLGHPGGPFWVKKDAGAWSMPKGEVGEDEDLFEAAKREFTEETGQTSPEGNYIELGSFKNSSGKEIFAWAAEGDLDVAKIESSKTTIEWPPKSGIQMEIPEIDRARWVSVADAPKKMHKGQDVFVQRLIEKLGIAVQELPEQQSLL